MSSIYKLCNSAPSPHIFQTSEVFSQVHITRLELQWKLRTFQNHKIWVYSMSVWR